VRVKAFIDLPKRTRKKLWMLVAWSSGHTVPQPAPGRKWQSADTCAQVWAQAMSLLLRGVPPGALIFYVVGPSSWKVLGPCASLSELRNKARKVKKNCRRALVGK